MLTAGSATEALALCAWERDAGRTSTLLVTDLDLPDFGGVHLARSVRAVDGRVPVVA